MSNPHVDDGSLQTTRQMLDDLDALMEKMLALPVNDLDDAQPFPKDVVRTPTLSAKLTLLQAPPEPPVPPSEPTAPPPVSATAVEPFVGLPPPPHEPFQPPHFALPVETESPRKPPTPAPPPLTNDIMPPSFRKRVDAAPVENPAVEEPMLARGGVHPLLWINQVFDQATTFLGDSGAALRGPTGRALLGISGLALILVAVGWFLKDWMGWNWPWTFIG